MADDAATSPKRSDFAGPWARFLAKQVDALVVVILSVLAGTVMSAIDLFTGTALMDPLMMSSPRVSFLLNTLVGVLIWIAYDVVQLVLFGKTLGKKALGVSVVQGDGKPGWAAAIKRSTLLQALGLAFGIPILSTIAAIWGYGQVESEGRTVWDKVSGTDTLGKPIGWWRWAVGIAIWILIWAMAILGMMSQLDRVMGL